MTNPHQVTIAHLTWSAAFSERARLDGEGVHVGNALRYGFGVVAADTVLGAEHRAFADSREQLPHRDLDTLFRCIAKRNSPQVHVKDEARVMTYLEVFFRTTLVALKHWRLGWSLPRFAGTHRWKAWRIPCKGRTQRSRAAFPSSCRVDEILRLLHAQLCHTLS